MIVHIYLEAFESMYTNIDTNKALSTMCPFLWENEEHFGHYNVTTLIEATEIVMPNNIVKFCDVYAKRCRGTAMENPPDPTLARTFEGIQVLNYLPTWRPSILLFLRYIDDIIGAWDPQQGLALMLLISHGIISTLQ